MVRRKMLSGNLAASFQNCHLKIFFRLHCESDVIIPERLLPFGVSEYSTLGGISGKAFRATIPCCPNSFNCLESTFNAMPGIPLCNSPNRFGPSSKTQIIIGFHFPPITSMVAVMGHSSALLYFFSDFFSFKINQFLNPDKFVNTGQNGNYFTKVQEAATFAN